MALRPNMFVYAYIVLVGRPTKGLKEKQDKYVSEKVWCFPSATRRIRP